MSLILIPYGTIILYRTKNLMGLALIFFGYLGTSLSYNAYKRWQKPIHPSEWLLLHIHLMTGAFSAALTAFIVLQFSGKVGSFEWGLWIAPTVFMNFFAKREAKKLNLISNE